MKLPNNVKAFFRRNGLEGGKKRMASLTPAERLQFAMKGVAARKRKRKNAAR